MQKLTLGFSPCPNDTFIFDALVHQKIDTQGLEFDVQLLDVEELNQKAIANELNITKLSYHAFAHVSDKYVLLNAGSALGRNCGPLLIAKQPLSEEELVNATIAIPGEMTTANLLFSFAYPNAKQKQSVLFSDIESGVVSGEFDAGVIIHENRFTYADKGLVKIQDLGEYWENKTKHPIPLGGIAIQRGLDAKLQHKVDGLIRASIEYAYKHPDSSLAYMRQHAQEMDANVMKQHVDLYVNDFSLDLGTEGKAAIENLIDIGQAIELFENVQRPLII